ncbi:MAG: hypothetical protein IJ089_11820 [Clostridia bacterium]|nr:hypothetical protein [Clostridia bacterium]
MKTQHTPIPRGQRGGVNRLVAILLALIAVMLVIIAIPVWNVKKERAQVIACEQALKSAGDGLIIEYLGRFKEESVENAMAAIDEIMPARPNICPANGTVYLVKDENGIYQPLCGLHDPDTKRRVRLNASRAMELLKEQLRIDRRDAKAEPESVDISLNGQTLTCVRVAAEEPLRRGTGTTKGYDGVVAFYGLAGEGDFSPAGLEDGEICYFVYADKNHCAIWRSDDGWTGDAYKQ